MDKLDNIDDLKDIINNKIPNKISNISITFNLDDNIDYKNEDNIRTIEIKGNLYTATDVSGNIIKLLKDELNNIIYSYEPITKNDNTSNISVTYDDNACVPYFTNASQLCENLNKKDNSKPTVTIKNNSNILISIIVLFCCLILLIVVVILVLKNKKTS